MNRLQLLQLISIVITCITFNTYSCEWPVLLERYHNTMAQHTHAIITRQYKEFSEGYAPTIADSRIKSIAISECNDPIVDLYDIKHHRIRVMEGEYLQKAHTCPEDIDPRSEKHSCIRKGVCDALVRMIVILDELAPSFGYQPGELEIHLFEGLRDIATQKTLFDTLFATIKLEQPHLSNEEAYAETAKFVSPYINNVPVHSTGAALDIHLWSNKKQSYCNMGRFNSSKDGAPTFTENVSEVQKIHRLLMLIAATRSGLTNYLYEFWHFSYGDRYSCYWHGDEYAIYGSI